jgi:hypothetical protein
VEPISTSAVIVPVSPSDGQTVAGRADSRWRRVAAWLLRNSVGKIVAAAILYCQCIRMHSVYWSAHWSTSFRWPFVAFWPKPPGSSASWWQQIAYGGALANFVFAAVVTAGTMAVFARCRGGKWFQWKLSAWFVLVALFAVSLCIESSVPRIFIGEFWQSVGLRSNPWGPAKTGIIDHAHAPPAIVRSVVSFGVTCTLFATVLNLARFIPRRGR